MTGIDPSLYKQIKAVLLECGPFESNELLSNVFLDQRINGWKNILYEAKNKAERVDSIISLLYVRYNTLGENALLLFLQVLADRANSEDLCYRKLLLLADQLEKKIKISKVTDQVAKTSIKLSRKFPFPGLESLGIEDQNIFFGRDEEIKRLLNHIQQDSLVVVNGLSGCGKSSLVKAGVIPQLLESGHQVLYVSVVENILNEVLSRICYEVNVRNLAEDWVEAFLILHKQRPNCRIVLIIDQFEQSLTPAHDAHSLELFLKGIPRLLSTIRNFLRIVIVVRADWLYYLEVSAKNFYPSLNIYTYILTIHPLCLKSAREAIIKPLQMKMFPYDEIVVDEIIDSLQSSIEGIPSGTYIQPIQLQIVLRELFMLAERRNELTAALTQSNYKASGGVENILRNYLANTVGKRFEAWRLLARFIASDNKTRRTRRHSELLTVPAAEDVEIELRFLVNQGLLEVYEAEDDEENLYRLSHDYLVEAIVNYLNENSDQLGWKLAEDWLINGTLEWRNSKQTGSETELLLERNRYLHIYKYRDRLNLTDEDRLLLILTSLYYGHKGIGYWLSRGNKSKKDADILIDKLLSCEDGVSEFARQSIEACNDIDNEDEILDSYYKSEMHDMLIQVLLTPETLDKQEVAAQALWILNTFQSSGERLRVGQVVIRRWLKENALQVASYLLTITLVLFLVFSGVYIQNALRGSWETIYSLNAGHVFQVDVAPDESGAIYAVTSGQGSREGNSLFVNETGNWELLSRDFSTVKPSAMELVKNGDQLDIYIALYSQGIIHSSDQGKTWDLMNNGLPSRGLTSLAADLNNPGTLYLGTVDWRGVLKSEDWGKSWDFFDYYGELYGAQISHLAFTQANGGILIAGTEDGRILSHSYASTDWQLRFGLSKGAILTLIVAPSNENYIYAGTNRGIVLRSTDGGGTWRVLGQIDNKFQINKIAVHPLYSEQVYAIAYGEMGNTLWQSKDAGESWEIIESLGLPHSGINSLVFENKTPYSLIAGTTEGLFLSQDSGMYWERAPLTKPLAWIRQIALGENSQAPIYAVVDASVYTNLDGGLENWVYGKGLRAESVRQVVVDPYDPKTAYAGVLLLGEWALFKTKDGGQIWESTKAPSIEPVISDITSLAITKSEMGHSILYAGSLGCGVFRSEDQGETWETFGRTHCNENVDETPTDITFLAIDAVDPYNVYAAAGLWFYHSIDGGKSWDFLNMSNMGIRSSIIAVVSDPCTSNLVYLATQSHGLWRSRDGGSTWEQLADDWIGNNEPTTMIALTGNPKGLIVGDSNGGVWISTNEGNNWRSIRENLTISNISGIASNTQLDGQIIISSLTDGISIYTPGRLFQNRDYQSGEK